MRLNNPPIMKMSFHLTYTNILIRWRHMTLRNGHDLQGQPRNVGIGCLLRKEEYGIHYNKKPRILSWVINNNPNRILIVTIYIMLPLVILTNLVPIRLILVTPITTLPTLILRTRIIILISVLMMLWL